MATTETALRAPAKADVNNAGTAPGFLVTFALALLAILIHGYHPSAEDGGLYLAGIKRVLDPTLYPHWGEFVSAHLRFSLFAPTIASLVRATSIGLMPVMLALHLASLWATLHACWLIAQHVTLRPEVRFGAVLSVALLMSIPVAGTSLILMDPYVTARSISTPGTLLAIACALRFIYEVNQNLPISWTSLALGLFSLLIAAAMHPLMAAYGFGCVLLLLCSSLESRRARLAALLLLCGLAIAIAGILQHFSLPQTPAYAAVAQTRAYWFIETWRWYELLGIIAPLILLFVYWTRPTPRTASAALAHMSVAAGITSILTAVLFARIHSGSYIVAKLQPLRIFQTIYMLLLIVLGSLAAQFLLKRVAWRWIFYTALLGGFMFWVQLQVFPGSRHLELPWAQPHNPWVRAFEWIRSDTPKDAVFAMDANYIYMPGEDAQNFRSIAERGALADLAKDAGIASIAPDLTQRWTQGVDAQRSLDAHWSPARIPALEALSATWVILSRSTSANLDCPYANERVKVCRLP